MCTISNTDETVPKDIVAKHLVNRDSVELRQTEHLEEGGFKALSVVEEIIKSGLPVNYSY